jgi:hypothetical protein
VRRSLETLDLYPYARRTLAGAKPVAECTVAFMMRCVKRCRHKVICRQNILVEKDSPGVAQHFVSALDYAVFLVAICGRLSRDYVYELTELVYHLICVPAVIRQYFGTEEPMLNGHDSFGGCIGSAVRGGKAQRIARKQSHHNDDVDVAVLVRRKGNNVSIEIFSIGAREEIVASP